MDPFTGVIFNDEMGELAYMHAAIAESVRRLCCTWRAGRLRASSQPMELPRARQEVRFRTLQSCHYITDFRVDRYPQQRRQSS